MTRFSAETPGDRRALAAEAVIAHRRRASEAAVLEADGRQLTYADRVLSVPADDDERDRLESLLADYPVFKIEQPATRKAEADVVHVSAIADPKHVADFVDDCFRRVYGLVEEYELWVARV